MHLVYLDQNILGYLSEGKISLQTNDDLIWVYSDAHLDEIARSGKLQLLDCLDEIRARKIRVALDSKFSITDDYYIDGTKSAHHVYAERQHAVRLPKFAYDLILLQSFFGGNREALRPDDIRNDFVSAINSIRKTAFKDSSGEEIQTNNDAEINQLGTRLESALRDVSEKIMPIQELRKSCAGIDLSNLDESKGDIVAQIWERIPANIKSSISKEQLFFKEPHPILSQCAIQSRFLRIIGCYTALNFLGYWPDKKMSTISKISGINSDAAHVAYGSACSALLSEDHRLCKKASAIYEYFGIHTVVCPVEVAKIEWEAK